jgi:Protein of unknown function (DUF4238)
MHIPVKGKKPSKTSRAVGKKHRTRGRKDHYLPQGYLRGFISPSRTELQKPLWYFDAHRKHWSELSPAEIGFERGFYDSRGIETNVETADQVFAELERTFPLVREEMVADQFSNWTEHLDFLLRYFQMMRARSPLAFEQRQARDRNRQFLKVVKVSGRSITYEPAQVTETFLKNKAIAEMRQEIQKGADWLNRFHWALRYSVSPDMPFILSDTPCIVEGKFSTLEEAMQRPDTLIVFPLCWQACLFGSLARFDIKTDEFSSADLQTIHRKHFDKAREFIVSPVKLEGL